jgi:hypothetical protein
LKIGQKLLTQLPPSRVRFVELLAPRAAEGVNTALERRLALRLRNALDAAHDRERRIGVAAHDDDDARRAALLRERLHRALGDELASVDDDDARAARLHLRQDVRREEDSVLGAELFDDVADVADLVRVETCRGLVEHEERRLRNERIGEPDALAIALREIADEDVRDVEHVRLLHRVVDERATVAARDALQLRAEREVFADAHLRIERDRFGHVADLRACLEARVADVVAGDDDLAARRAEEAGEDAQRSALARAVRPEEADDLAFVHLEREVVDCDLRSVALDQVLDRDHPAPIA